MDRRVLSGDDAVARLRERQAAFERTVASTQEMATRMQALKATASDANGLATVTLAAAKLRVAAQTQEVIAETVGADSDTGRAVAQDLQARLLGGERP
jgi:methyl-accepting chemotaxis protein